MKPTAPPINPQKRSFVPPPPELSAKAARNIFRIFACLLAVPFLFELAAWFTPSKDNLAAGAVRSALQWVLSRTLNEGNKTIHIGLDGWLFEQREIDRIVRAERPESELHAGILQLAARLKAQETPLLVVVIPAREALHPEQIRSGRYAGPVRVKEESARLQELNAAGAEVLDMTDALWEFGERNQVFFAQDSHWTPGAMKAVALAVNKHVRKKLPRLPSTETPIITATLLTRNDAGDLARQLDPRRPAALMGEEQAELVSIQGMEPDAKSPVALHGGNLLRVFDDPALSFGGGGGDLHAGFATQLATLLGRPLDVRGMPRAGESYDGKKLVICLLPMSELVP